MPSVTMNRMKLWGSKGSKSPVTQDDANSGAAPDNESVRQSVDVGKTDMDEAEASASILSRQRELRSRLHQRIYLGAELWLSSLCKKKVVPFELPSDELKGYLEADRVNASARGTASNEEAKMRSLLVAVSAKEKVLATDSVAVALETSARTLLAEPGAEEHEQTLEYADQLQLFAALHAHMGTLQTDFSANLTKALSRLARSRVNFDGLRATEKKCNAAKEAWLAAEKKRDKTKEGKGRREAEDEERKARAAYEDAMYSLEGRSSYVVDEEMTQAGTMYLRKLLEAELAWVEAQRSVLLAATQNWSRPDATEAKLQALASVAEEARRTAEAAVSDAQEKQAPTLPARTRAASMPRLPLSRLNSTRAVQGQNSGGSSSNDAGTTSRSSTTAATSAYSHGHSNSLGAQTGSAALAEAGFSTTVTDSPKRSRLASLTNGLTLTRTPSSNSIPTTSSKKGDSSMAGGASGSSSGGGMGSAAVAGMGAAVSSTASTLRGLTSKLGGGGSKRKEASRPGFRAMGDDGEGEFGLGHIKEMSGQADDEEARKLAAQHLGLSGLITQRVPSPAPMSAAYSSSHGHHDDFAHGHIPPRTDTASPGVAAWTSFDGPMSHGGLSPDHTGAYGARRSSINGLLSVSNGPMSGGVFDPLYSQHTGFSDGDPFGGSGMSPQPTGSATRGHFAEGTDTSQDDKGKSPLLRAGTTESDGPEGPRGAIAPGAASKRNAPPIPLPSASSLLGRRANPPPVPPVLPRRNTSKA